MSPFYEVYRKQQAILDAAVVAAAKNSATGLGKRFAEVYALGKNRQGPEKSGRP